jgi:hypothetical protein
MGQTQVVVRPVEVSLPELSRTSPTWLYVARPQIGAPRGRRGPSGGGCSGRRPTTFASGPVTLGCNLAPRHGPGCASPACSGSVPVGRTPASPWPSLASPCDGFSGPGCHRWPLRGVVTSHEADDAGNLAADQEDPAESQRRSAGASLQRTHAIAHKCPESGARSQDAPIHSQPMRLDGGIRMRVPIGTRTHRR